MSEFTEFLASIVVLLKEALIIVQILICPILILLVLLQSGKGDDLGSALGGGGGGGSGTVLGTGGTSKFLVKGTAIFSILFMINSVTLAWIFKHEASRNIGEGIEESITPTPEAQQQLNQEPAAPTTAPTTATPPTSGETGGSAAPTNP